MIDWKINLSPFSPAREQGFNGLLVKARPEAEGFFLARGLTPLPVTDAERDYPHRFWLEVA